jgi:hypothetical protein
LGGTKNHPLLAVPAHTMPCLLPLRKMATGIDAFPVTEPNRIRAPRNRKYPPFCHSPRPVSESSLCGEDEATWGWWLRCCCRVTSQSWDRVSARCLDSWRASRRSGWPSNGQGQGAERWVPSARSVTRRRRRRGRGLREPTGRLVRPTRAEPGVRVGVRFGPRRRALGSRARRVRRGGPSRGRCRRGRNRVVVTHPRRAVLSRLWRDPPSSRPPAPFHARTGIGLGWDRLSLVSDSWASGEEH